MGGGGDQITGVLVACGREDLVGGVIADVDRGLVLDRPGSRPYVRYAADGEPIYHHMGCSAFAEYAVARETMDGNTEAVPRR